MINILLVANEEPAITEMTMALADYHQVKLERSSSLDHVKRLLSENQYRLAIISEITDGMNSVDLAKLLVCVNPMVNFAVMSDLSSEEYEEAAEGLGLVTQLPTQPGREDIKTLMGKLLKILELQGVTGV